MHSEKPLYEDEWLDIRLADVELPGGRHLEHRLIRTPPGAGCVTVQDGRVLLLWRHRFITGTWGWEIPVGKIDPGEDPAQAAARETEEETGWQPGPLSPLLRVGPTPGISDSVHHIYLADGAKCIGPPEDDFESERVSWVPLTDVPALISHGEISTGTTLAALLFALARQPPETEVGTHGAATHRTGPGNSTDSARGPETTGNNRHEWGKAPEDGTSESIAWQPFSCGAVPGTRRSAA